MAKGANTIDPSSPIARLQQAARRAKQEGDLEQAAKYTQAAVDLGADDSDDIFQTVLRRLSKATATPAFGRIPKVKR